MNTAIADGSEDRVTDAVKTITGRESQEKLGSPNLTRRSSPSLDVLEVATGQLDTKSADSVFEPMRQVNRESGANLLTATHNLELAKRCDRIIDVLDGRIES